MTVQLLSYNGVYPKQPTYNVSDISNSNYPQNMLVNTVKLNMPAVARGSSVNNLVPFSCLHTIEVPRAILDK